MNDHPAHTETPDTQNAETGAGKIINEESRLRYELGLAYPAFVLARELHRAGESESARKVLRTGKEEAMSGANGESADIERYFSAASRVLLDLRHALKRAVEVK